MPNQQGIVSLTIQKSHYWRKNMFCDVILLWLRVTRESITSYLLVTRNTVGEIERNAVLFVLIPPFHFPGFVISFMYWSTFGVDPYLDLNLGIFGKKSLGMR